MNSRESGFTLFEVVLVITLIVIIGAVSYPSLQSMAGGFRSTAASDAVRAVWAQARAKAMNDGIPYRFSVAYGKGNYRLAPDTPEFWSGNGGAPQASDTSTRPLVLEDAVTKTVRFSTPASVQDGEQSGGSEDTIAANGTLDPGAWSTVVVFLPDGTARDNAELVILTSGARPLVLKIRGLTGVVTSGPM